MILRRLDSVLKATKADVLAEAAKISNPDQLDLVVRKKVRPELLQRLRLGFDNLLSDPSGLRSNLIDYTNKLSSNVFDIFERFGLENTLATLDEKDRFYFLIQQFKSVDFHSARMICPRMAPRTVDP